VRRAKIIITDVDPPATNQQLTDTDYNARTTKSIGGYVVKFEVLSLTYLAQISNGD
jgi:hypothetical protein